MSIAYTNPRKERNLICKYCKQKISNSNKLFCNRDCLKKYLSGKSWEELYGKEKADKYCKNLSDAMKGKTLPLEVREKMKKNHHGNPDHWKAILEESKKLENDGYRCIPLTKTIPDIIALKNGKIYAIEVEVKRNCRLRNLDKYDISGTKNLFDDIIWIIRRDKNTKWKT
jgi:hypothetical protein